MTPKLLSRRILFLLVFGIFVLPSCQKLLDYIHAHPGDGDADFKSCNIKKITVVFSTGISTYNVHYLFTYDSYGNPLRIMNDLVSTGNPNFYFRYDKYNRLIQKIRPYSSNGLYETFNKYAYNAKNQIVRDTQYAFGHMSGDTALPDPNTYAYTEYTYDAQNRIIHQSSRVFRNNTWVFPSEVDIAYNAAGNRLPGDYDDKISLNRTNKVWMFLNKDYSVNNPFIATRYNHNNLPAFIDNGHIQLLPLEGKITIEYMCP